MPLFLSMQVVGFLMQWIFYFLYNKQNEICDYCFYASLTTLFLDKPPRGSLSVLNAHFFHHYTDLGSNKPRIGNYGIYMAGCQRCN